MIQQMSSDEGDFCEDDNGKNDMGDDNDGGVYYDDEEEDDINNAPPWQPFFHALTATVAGTLPSPLLRSRMFLIIMLQQHPIKVGVIWIAMLQQHLFVVGVI